MKKVVIARNSLIFVYIMYMTFWRAMNYILKLKRYLIQDL